MRGKEMKLAKTLCLSLALVLVGTCFAACGKRPNGEQTFTYEQVMAKFNGEIEKMQLFASLIIKWPLKRDI